MFNNGILSWIKWVFIKTVFKLVTEIEVSLNFFFGHSKNIVRKNKENGL